MAEYYVSSDEEWFTEGPYADYDSAVEAGHYLYPDGFFLGVKGKDVLDLIKDCDFALRICEECDVEVCDHIETDDPAVELSPKDGADLNKLIVNFLVERKAIGGQFSIDDVKWVHPLESGVSDE